MSASTPAAGGSDLVETRVIAAPRRQAAAQRRELELSMGERFARMLAPACQGGEAP